MGRSSIIASWCLFEWAVTPFPTIVVTFVISNYFTHAFAADPTLGSARWGYMIAATGLVIAVLSPPLGAIADRLGRAKRGAAIGALVTVSASALIWFARPDPSLATIVLILCGAGIVAYELGVLFFNALLPTVAPKRLIGRVSGWGWGLGYAGGLACLGIALVFLIQPDQPAFGIGKEQAANIRACGPLAAIWLLLFGWPLFAFVPDLPPTGIPARRALREGMAELRRTVSGLRDLPQMARFLIASAIYRDGISTILAIGGVYAGGTFGMGFTEIILFAIGINVTAGLGAMGFAWLDDWLGSKSTIALSLAGLLVFGALIILVHDKGWFFDAALALGIFIGPAQSASRSLLVRLAPPAGVGQYFGLYALTGRAVSFVGPALFGWVTATTHSQRAGLSVIMALLALGFVLLIRVEEPARRRQALAPVLES
ncbi:MAG TPA: MFS transporter [Alphaproteobacteria bacterium]|nr:MFS transporter [Alphaproteobacteria bacterium]